MIRIRKLRHPAVCRHCGRPIGKDEYGREVAIVVYVTLCGDCSYDSKEMIHNMPESIDLDQPRGITGDVMKALTKEGG